MAAFLLRDTRYIIRDIFLKVLLFSALAICYLLLTIQPAFAQASSPPAINAPYITNQYIPSQSPHSASLAIYNFSHAVSCILIGQSPIASCLEYKMYRDAQGMVKSIPVLSSTNTGNGVLGMSMSMIGEVISTPPIRSSEFIADLGKQLGIKEAHAQVGGSGSGVLASIFRLWEVSRNISYLVMILVFILVGFMVMFRQKLNPQTVVSIQMALPGLVIGLVMITFSYFLASLISDLAFVGTNVVGYYFALAQDSAVVPTQLPLRTPGPGGILREENALTMFARYTDILNGENIKLALDSIWPDLYNPNSQTNIWGYQLDAGRALTALASMIAVQFAMPLGGTFGGFGQFLTGSIATGIVVSDPPAAVAFSLALIAMIVLIYSMLRLLMRLITAFLTIIFLTIAAPFFFLAAALPGRQSIATTWMFNMLCNVLAFPAVFAIFYFVAFLLAGQRPNPDPLFAIATSAPPLSGTAAFPLLGGLRLDFLNALIAFGALVASPSIPDLICKAIGKPGQLGGIAAGALAGGIASGQRYYGQATGGITGMAGNIGNIADTPGYSLTSKGWKKYTLNSKSNAQEVAAAGVRPGLGSRIQASTGIPLGSAVGFVGNIPGRVLGGAAGIAGSGMKAAGRGIRKGIFRRP
jgi:hypothetical protein